MGKFKEGQRVIAVDQGCDFGKPQGSDRDTYYFNYDIGWKATISIDNINSKTWFNFDNGRVMRGCNQSSFELINESEKSMLTVGSKVTSRDGSYSYEFVNGELKESWSGLVTLDGKQCIYEITGINLTLPGRCEESNDTIIRRISDGKVFFVQQRFLKEYIAEPKFKRGQVVATNREYCRIVKVNNDGTYDISYFTEEYIGDGYGTKKVEDELKEVNL